MIQRHPKLGIAVMFTVLLLYVPLYGLYSFGVQTVFGSFAHDAFYYLTVAKNSSLFFFSFDGEKATNGFHPLWQYILTALFAVMGTHDSQIQLYTAYLLSAVLVTLGYVFAGWSLYRVTGSVYWSLLLIPGPFAALFTAKLESQVAQGVTYTYSPWAFMNGMESPCSVAAGGVFLFLFTHLCSAREGSPSQKPAGDGSGESSDRKTLVLGSILALVVLARLDDVFLVFATALYFLLSDWTGPRPFRRAFLAVLPTAIVLVVYLGFNYAYSQSLLPVSGRIKASGGAALTGNLAMSLCDLFPPLRSIIRPSYSLHDWGNTAARSSAMILPMVFGLWLGASLLRSRTRNAELFRKYAWVLPIVLYMVLKGGYNLVNVRLGSQGYWYYTLTVFMVNYLVLAVIWETIPRRGIAVSGPFKHLCAGLYICFYLFISAQTISLGSFVDNRFYPVWRDREEITAALKSIDPQVKLIDRSDGTYAYALDMPAVCALGYAIDKEGYEAMKDNRFLEYCLARGFQVTFQQKNAYPIPEEGCTFEKIYEHKASGAVFVRIVPSMGKGAGSTQ
jgi:hypothetical protein